MRLPRLLIPSCLLALTLAIPAAAAEGPPTKAKTKTSSKSDWPATREGALARRWVEAFSKGEKAMRATLLEILTPEGLAKTPMDERMARYRDSYERMGPLMLIRIDKSEPGELVAILAGSDYSETPFTFKVQTQAPFKLISVTRTENRQVHGHGGFSHGGGNP